MSDIRSYLAADDTTVFIFRSLTLAHVVMIRPLTLAHVIASGTTPGGRFGAWLDKVMNTVSPSTLT
jgi:hypothetical protein